MSENFGIITQVIGPSVDVRFEPDCLPEILHAVTIDDEKKEIHLTLEVAQHVARQHQTGIAPA